MRCYIVQIDLPSCKAKRLAATNALARETRETMMADFEVKKKDVTIEAHEVPTPKTELLDYINEVYVTADITEADE